MRPADKKTNISDTVQRWEPGIRSDSSSTQGLNFCRNLTVLGCKHFNSCRCCCLNIFPGSHVAKLLSDFSEGQVDNLIQSATKCHQVLPPTLYFNALLVYKHLKTNVSLYFIYRNISDFIYMYVSLYFSFLVKLNTACLVALCVIVVLLIAVAAVQYFTAHFHECTCTC